MLRPGQLIPAGIALVGVTYGLARYAYGLFLPQIRDDLRLDAQSAGLIAGLSYIGYLIATLIGAALARRFGARLPMLAGGSCAALGMALIGLSDSVWTLGLGVFLAGTSPGLAYPPLSVVIMRHVRAPSRESTYTWINSGTSFGVMLAAPIAIWAGGTWRDAWLIFAGLAALTTLWNAALLPQSAVRVSAHRPSWRERMAVWNTLLARPGARSHFVSALIFGITSSVYWTFAVDLLVRDASWNSSQTALFWSLVGIAGVLGFLAGRAVQVFGLRNCFTVLLAVFAVAIAAHPFAARIEVLTLLSGAVFGGGFIALTALYGIDSIRLSNDNPSIAFGTTFFLISLGQFVGPVLSGALISVFGLSPVFVAFGAITACLMLWVPSDNVRSMTT